MSPSVIKPSCPGNYMNQIPPSKSSVVPWFSFPNIYFFFPYPHMSGSVLKTCQFKCEACFSHYYVAVVGLVLPLPVSGSSLSLFFFLPFLLSFPVSLFHCIGLVFAKHNISTVESLLGACVLNLGNTHPHMHVSGKAPLCLWTPHLSGKLIGRSYVCTNCWMGHCAASLAPCVWLKFASDTLVCSTRKENASVKAFCSVTYFTE